MKEEGNAEPEPPEDHGNRNVENAVMLGFFCGAGGGGSLVARHHGRYTKGSGLRRPGATQLFDDRCSRAGAIVGVG
jgi:hypothetical protein